MIKKIKSMVGRSLLNYYKQKKQKSLNTSLDHSLKTARSMLKKAKYCFLITNSRRDWPSARMVQPIIELDTFVVWIGTNPTLRKISEIKKNPNVTLAFGDEREDANLIIYGKASIVDDSHESRKHWINSGFLFFPDSPEGDEFVLIRIEPAEMELMNFKKKYCT